VPTVWLRLVRIGLYNTLAAGAISPPPGLIDRNARITEANVASSRNIMKFVLLFTVFSIVFSFAARGQGFMVQPMKVEAAVRPGITARIPIQIRNTSNDGKTRLIEVKAVYLTQTSGGSWSAVDPESNDPKPTDMSCLPWTKVATNEVPIAPMNAETVDVLVAIPRNARGFYFMGVQVKSNAQEGEGVNVQFLIPIILEIQGLPVRQIIKVTDVTMKRLTADNKRSSTLVMMEVENTGTSFPRIEGTVKVMIERGNRWRPVAIAALPKRSIMPGLTLILAQDIERRLPSGHYKLLGTLMVNGRRAAPLEKEFDYEGDPGITSLVVGDAITLSDSWIEIEAVAGAYRAATITLENASEDPVEYTVESRIPETLKGVAMGTLRGSDLSCFQWLEAIPQKGRIAPGRKRNLRVQARMPRESFDKANYYATVKIGSKYADGQKAGETEALLCVSNTAVEAAPAASIVKANMVADEANKYIIQGRVANIGNVHYIPNAWAELTSSNALESFAKVLLSGEEGMLLPMQFRDYSGELDFAGIEPGSYALAIGLGYGSGSEIKRLPVHVEAEDGHKVVTIIDGSEQQPTKQNEK